MPLNIRPAVASEAKPLVGIYGESGSGKTRSSLLAAKGFARDMSRVVMIETESGRGEAYADDSEVGGYNVISLRTDFSPRAYGDAITAAESVGARVLIIDSASAEWEGTKGVLDMAAENQAAGKKGVLVWQTPKIEHARHFMLRLLQTPIPLVLVCMRAKYPMEEKLVNGRKEWTRSEQLAPKQSEDILYEMFVHGWIDHQHRFHGTKYTIDALRKVFIDGEPISVETGKRLAEWAAGSKAAASERPTGAASVAADGTAATFIDEQQIATLETMCQDYGVVVAALKKAAKVERMADIAANRYESCKTWIKEHATKAVA